MNLSELVRRYLLYGLSGPIIVLNLWVLIQIFEYFRGPLNFIILAIILALILNYFVRFIEFKLKLDRIQATMVVLSLFILLVILLGITLVPAVVNQATQLIEDLPNLLAAGGRNFEWVKTFVRIHHLPIDLDEISNQLNTRTQDLITALPELAINTIGQIFTTIFLIVLAFYMLLYGDRCWRELINLLPEKLAKALTISLTQQFHYFFKSQILLALFMMFCLTPTLLILKINFALFFAIVIGFFEIIPLFGATIGIGLVTLLVLMLHGLVPALKVVFFGVLFQQIKDNLIAPRLVGHITGLNPIWIFITLMIGGRVAGFVGVVLALPIAGTIKSTFEAMRNSDMPPHVPESKINPEWVKREKERF